MQSNSEDQLVAALSGLRLQDTDLPTRPGFGTVGTAIKLRTNFFPVRVPKGPLFEYDIAISPSVTAKHLKRRIFQLAEITNDWQNAGMGGTVAHDHSAKLISARALPQPLVITVPFTDEEDDNIPSQPAAAKPKGGKKGGKKTNQPKEYVLTIKFVQELETESLVRYVLNWNSFLAGKRKGPEVRYTRYHRGSRVFILQALASPRVFLCPTLLLHAPLFLCDHLYTDHGF